MSLYVSTAQLAQHAGKHRVTVFRALKAAGVKVERFPGAKGGRLPVREANKFLNRQWPEVGPLPSQQ